MKLSTDSYINEPLEIKKDLLSFFKAEDKIIIFDIGACEGEDSVKYSNLFPNAKIYTFEPVPNNFEKAKINIQKYNKANKINLFQIALSDNTGEATFYVSSGKPEGLENDENWDYGNKSSSLLQPGKATQKYYKWLEFKEEIKVKTETILNFTKENNISVVDFAHIDVQGAGLMVLSGAGNFLQNFKIIFIEVEAMDLYKNQPLKTDLEKFMFYNGFYLYFDEVGKVTGDQFYVNKKYFDKKVNIKRVIKKIYSTFKYAISRKN